MLWKAEIPGLIRTGWACSLLSARKAGPTHAHASSGLMPADVLWLQSAVRKRRCCPWTLVWVWPGQTAQVLTYRVCSQLLRVQVIYRNTDFLLNLLFTDGMLRNKAIWTVNTFSTLKFHNCFPTDHDAIYRHWRWGWRLLLPWIPHINKTLNFGELRGKGSLFLYFWLVHHMGPMWAHTNLASTPQLQCHRAADQGHDGVSIWSCDQWC